MWCSRNHWTRRSTESGPQKIFSVPLRYVRTNKDKSNKEENLVAKSRIVLPGHVDPDGDIPVEDGGFRTDAPTAPQIAFHMLCSTAVRRKWRLQTFDCKNAFLTGKEQTRELYVHPPKEGLAGVEPGSLIKMVKGVYGLREAPRLWYKKAREAILDAGWEELQTAKATFVVRDPKTKELCGMMVLHVDDACYAGKGPYFQSCVDYLKKTFTLGAEGVDDFEFLGRHVVQKPDFTIEIDQHQFCLLYTSHAADE